MSVSADGSSWRHQPVAWIGISVLIASFIGCGAMLALAFRFDDPPLPVAGLRVLSVPIAPYEPSATAKSLR